MSEYTKEFDDWWYKPLLDSAKWNDGVPDKDMMRYKDLGKQSAFHAWVARYQEITKLKKALSVANEAIGFYADKNNWERISVTQGSFSFQTEWASNLKFNDCALYNAGGGKARLAQKQIQEIMEGCENENKN